MKCAAVVVAKERKIIMKMDKILGEEMGKQGQGT